MVTMEEVKVTGIPAAPQIGPPGDKVAMGLVFVILPTVQLRGIAENVTFPEDETEPLLFVP